jgi:hypothetical protein
MTSPNWGCVAKARKKKGGIIAMLPIESVADADACDCRVFRLVHD